jgi:hypothetical protein
MSRFYAIHRMLIQEKQRMNEMMKQIKIENEIFRNKEMLERLNKNMNKQLPISNTYEPKFNKNN